MAATVTARLTATGPRFTIGTGAVGLGEFAALLWLAEHGTDMPTARQLLSNAAYDAHTRQIADVAVAL